MHYSKETPSCSTFRVITTNCLGVRIFRKFTVLLNLTGIDKYCIRKRSGNERFNVNFNFGLILNDGSQEMLSLAENPMDHFMESFT